MLRAIDLEVEDADDALRLDGAGTRGRDVRGIQIAGDRHSREDTNIEPTVADNRLSYGGCGDNTLSALITRGMVEIQRLGVTLGAQADTFSGLSGIGDLITTCVSPYGRNRSVGLRIGQGESIEDILASMDQVAEGVKTTRVVMELGAKHDVDLPIAREVHGVLYEGRKATDAYRGLMRRPGAESDPD